MMRREILLLCMAFPAGMILFHWPSNPPVFSGRTIEARLDPPAEVTAVLDRACKDCHSNATRWPWYASIAPLSWIITSDVERARRYVNFSDWRAKQGVAIGALLASCQDIQTGQMPPAGYRMMHRESRVTAAQAEAFCSWTALQARAMRDRNTHHASLANDLQRIRE